MAIDWATATKAEVLAEYAEEIRAAKIAGSLQEIRQAFYTLREQRRQALQDQFNGSMAVFMQEWQTRENNNFDLSGL